MDLKELKKLIKEEKKRIKESIGKDPVSSDEHIVFLKTLMSLPPNEIYKKFNIKGLEGIVNSVKYMKIVSDAISQAQPLDITQPEGETAFLEMISNPKVRNSLMQTVEDLSIKDEYQKLIEDFIDRLAFIQNQKRNVPRPVSGIDSIPPEYQQKPGSTQA